MNSAIKMVHTVTGKRAEIHFDAHHAWSWTEGWSVGETLDYVGSKSAGKALLARMTGRQGWVVAA